MENLKKLRQKTREVEVYSKTIASLREQIAILKRDLKRENGSFEAAEEFIGVTALRPLKVAFRNVALFLHPDRNPGEDQAERLMKLANKYHEILKGRER